MDFPRCKQCGSLECGPYRCRFAVTTHDFRDEGNPMEKTETRFTPRPEYAERGQYGRGR